MSFWLKLRLRLKRSDIIWSKALKPDFLQFWKILVKDKIQLKKSFSEIRILGQEILRP